MFKPGDLVEYATEDFAPDGTGTYWNRGQAYRVLEVNVLGIRVECNRGKSTLWQASDFKLVRPRFSRRLPSWF